MANPILVRQAVRKFKADKISQSAINKLIEAFNAAPCGLNETQVMQCTVVESDEALSLVKQQVGGAVYDAPLIFLLSSEKDNQFGPLDCAVAAENIMVAAANLGLGSLYDMSGGMALNEYPQVLRRLGVPDNFEAQVAVLVGKTEQELKELNRDGRYKVVRK